MATVQPVIVGDSFALGYRFQKYWDVSMANAFFCGELGAGLFFISFFYQVMPGMILGLLITGFLKTYFHLAHMGVPAKSWRAIIRPDRAWISRGLISIGFFITFGALHVLIESNGLFWIAFQRWRYVEVHHRDNCGFGSVGRHELPRPRHV